MITDEHYQTKDTDEDKLRLDALVAELRSRGKEAEIQKLIYSRTRRRPFHTDSNGYFVRRDGNQFKPNCDAQKDFVTSNARYVALISPRGGGKSSAGAQKAIKK